MAQVPVTSRLEPVAGVVDLRAYAEEVAATGDWLAGRKAPAFADAGAGVAAMAPVGDGRVRALPADEFLIVLSGRVGIETAGGGRIVETGRSAVLPSGLDFVWRAATGTVAVVVSCPGATSGEACVPIDESAALAPSGAPLAELLVGPTPSCRNHTDFESPTGEFMCGTWDSTPYHRRPMVYRHIELMHLLEGSVTFGTEDGESATFSKGDLFLAKRGAKCSWRSEVRVKKVYAIHRPK